MLGPDMERPWPRAAPPHLKAVFSEGANWEATLESTLYPPASTPSSPAGIRTLPRSGAGAIRGPSLDVRRVMRFSSFPSFPIIWQNCSQTGRGLPRSRFSRLRPTQRTWGLMATFGIWRFSTRRPLRHSAGRPPLRDSEGRNCNGALGARGGFSSSLWMGSVQGRGQGVRYPRGSPLHGGYHPVPILGGAVCDEGRGTTRGSGAGAPQRLRRWAC
jgi:hypothetical protein